MASAAVKKGVLAALSVVLAAVLAPSANAASSADTRPLFDVYVNQAAVAADGAFLVNEVDPKVCVDAAFVSGTVTLNLTGYGRIGSSTVPKSGQLCFELAPGIITGSAQADLKLTVSFDKSTVPVTLRPDFQAPTVQGTSSAQITAQAWGNPSSGQVTFSGDSTATWSFYLDGQLLAGTTGTTVTLSSLPLGYHYLQGLARDATGNVKVVSRAFGVGANPYTQCQADPAQEAALVNEGTDPFSAHVVACDANQAPKLGSAEVVERSYSLAGSNATTLSLAKPDSNPLDDTLDAVVVTSSTTSAAAAYSSPSRTTAVALATSCGRDTRKSGTYGVYYFTTSVYRCWDGRRVSSASTTRGFSVTTVGSIGGYRIDFWDDPPTKFYYTLNGVGNAAYRYTQTVYWSYGRPWSFQCHSTHTQRVYGSGATYWAWNKIC